MIDYKYPDLDELKKLPKEERNKELVKILAYLESYSVPCIDDVNTVDVVPEYEMQKFLTLLIHLIP